MTAYAYSRALNAGSGDLQFSGSTFVAATSPALEIVLRTLRTVRGSCLASPAFGVAWDRVATLRTTAVADARSAITDGLIGLVRANVIRDLVLDVEVDAGRGRVLFAVAFLDVRLGTRVSTGQMTTP